ncbi:MAG: hypothetical protein K2X47_04095, partial [Bdellovibrionales bacterium]|nr:hypothetical protein [Bdellovibrionales bacterium]
MVGILEVGTIRGLSLDMDLKKTLLFIGVIAAGLSLVNHFVGGLKFSGFRHAKMMKSGLDRDVKIAGGDWHMARSDRAALHAPEEPKQLAENAGLIAAEPALEVEQKKPGYNFQTNVKAMPMPKSAVEVKNGKDKKKKKKKKPTAVARKSVEIPAYRDLEMSTEKRGRTTHPMNLNPVTARQLTEFLQGPPGGGLSNADQVFSQLFQFGGNLQSIARLFELYQTKQIEQAVFFAVIERVLMSP